MGTDKSDWIRSKNELVSALVSLGFPKELGNEMAKNLGSTKAMSRMISYLYNVKPAKVELVVDEMLAICSDVAEWKEKKASEEANARYNEMMRLGFGEE